MIVFRYKVKIDERIRAKCQRHPRYNPERDGSEGIRGSCSTFHTLFDLYTARIELDRAIRDFLRRSGPWAEVRKPRPHKDKGSDPELPQARSNSQSTRRNLLSFALLSKGDGSL